MRKLSLLLVAVAMLLPIAGADAGTQVIPEAAAPNHRIPRAASRITVDGILEEPAWKHAWSMPLAYEVRPGENVPPPVETTVLVTYDEDAVYFAFRAFDPRPNEIRAHLSDRDNIGPDDWVAVILDTFNDERRSLDLIVNPLGVQSDSIETANGNDEWDAIWDSAGQITDWGYAVEMRVPFSSLRFQRSAGPQVWGFDAVRSYPRTVRHHIGAFPRDRSNNCYLCQALKIEGFEGAAPGKNLEVAPTITASRSDARSDLPAGELAKGSAEGQAGVTVRWGLTPNLTLSGTVNPDFSQVEADALQVDANEPFALFFAEKRPFFMEGSDFFKTQLNAVYTRMIREPSWGAKLTGKEGEHTLGGYVVRDGITNLIIPGSQSSSTATLQQASTVSVLRYKRDLGNRFTLGALATDREGESYFNRVVGFDSDLRLSDTDRISFQLLGSSTRYPDEIATDFEQPTGVFQDWAGEAWYSHSTRTVETWVMLQDFGADYRADLGYMPRVDLRLAEVGTGYTWIGDSTGWYSNLNLQVAANHATDHDGNLLFDQAVALFQYEGPLQSHAYVRLERGRRGYEGETFDISEVQLHNCMNPRDGTSTFVNLTFGDQVDYTNVRLGRRARANGGISQRLGRHFSVDLSGTWERMRELGQRLYTARVAETTLAWQFTPRSFIRAILQYVGYDYNLALYSDGRDARSRSLYNQLLFAYKINPQTVLFLGYSDASEGTQDYALTRTGRSFFAKVGYAWVP